ncbi:hypothetical protein J31TS4_15410 [Paenibacillus sp. J31TS4]|uniref:hypothetical protein n=1 Tax=Paenibacillus sp. J31TS4 TaxID=2807195 RepID=UPI001B11CC72|nr:hypothetical protein [Paenibacillus sp. J31TS4]GIP38261.1 hypothetical protein J31TS4_15410 [Paenibacillus sp. J31TS4]
MKGFKNVIWLSLALAMLLYAVPRLPVGGGWTPPAVFGTLWLSFALLIIGAHLHDILGVKEEQREQLRRIQRMKRNQIRRRLAGSPLLQARK